MLNYVLYRNDGNDANEPTIEVTSYSDNQMTYSLVAANEGMTAGLIYKLMMRAVNSKG